MALPAKFDKESDGDFENLLKQPVFDVSDTTPQNKPNLPKITTDSDSTRRPEQNDIYFTLTIFQTDPPEGVKEKQKK